MTKKARKIVIALFIIYFAVLFGGMKIEVFAACPDGSDNCNITGNYQINSTTVLRVHESASGSNPLEPRDIFIGKNAGAQNPVNNRAYGNIFIGKNAGSSMQLSGANTIIGDNAGQFLRGGLHNTILGTGANSSATYIEGDPYPEYSPAYCTIVGTKAGENNLGTGNVFLGQEAGVHNTTGSLNIMIGMNSGAGHERAGGLRIDRSVLTGGANIHIGTDTEVSSQTLSSTIALGHYARAEANHQFVIGSGQFYSICPVNANNECIGPYEEMATCPPDQGYKCYFYDHGLYTDSYWGSGVTSVGPQPFAFNASGGKGTNVAGADLILAGGKSTGSANGGRLVFKTSPKGEAGSSQNTLVERMVIDSEGRIGIGTNPRTTAKLNISESDRPILINAKLMQSNGNAPSYALGFDVTRTGNDALINDVVAITSSVNINNNNNVSGAIYPLSNVINFSGTTAGSSTVSSPLLTNLDLNWWSVNNARNWYIAVPASDVLSEGVSAVSGTGSITLNDFRHIWVKTSTAGNMNYQSGLWIDKQTQGTNNYGIVLAGDGYGSDITFGPNQEARIYSENGYLKAQDIRGNITQFSPHDPETGEWIFYSKNIKTGRTVRVNMEELVKDMEKLTGKKYLIESFVNE